MECDPPARKFLKSTSSTVIHPKGCQEIACGMNAVERAGGRTGGREKEVVRWHDLQGGNWWRAQCSSSDKLQHKLLGNQEVTVNKIGAVVRRCLVVASVVKAVERVGAAGRVNVEQPPLMSSRSPVSHKASPMASEPVAPKKIRAQKSGLRRIGLRWRPQQSHLPESSGLSADCCRRDPP